MGVIYCTLLSPFRDLKSHQKSTSDIFRLFPFSWKTHPGYFRHRSDSYGKVVMYSLTPSGDPSGHEFDMSKSLTFLQKVMKIFCRTFVILCFLKYSRFLKSAQRIKCEQNIEMFLRVLVTGPKQRKVTKNLWKSISGPFFTPPGPFRTLFWHMRICSRN